MQACEAAVGHGVTRRMCSQQPGAPYEERKKGAALTSQQHSMSGRLSDGGLLHLFPAEGCAGDTT